MGRIGAEMLFALSTPPNADASRHTTTGFDALRTWTEVGRVVSDFGAV